MKSQFAPMLAAMAVLSVTTAFAANPFSDVTPDSWAYQAVSQLAASGIVNGYPDGTFKGQKEITRFEMAQMVAKAMANQDRANAEQQAMINRLADEFSNELNNLGVRVGRLEDRVGNVKVTGDVRLRYLGTKAMGPDFIRSDGEYSEKTRFDARARIQFNAKVNDRTDAVVRVASDNFELGAAYNPSGESIGLLTVDRVYVNHKFGERVSVKAGRFDQMIGNGLIHDDKFDGVQLNIGNDKVQFQGAHGYLLTGLYVNVPAEYNHTISYASVKGQLNKHINVGGFFTRFNTQKVLDYSLKNVYGFSTDMKFNKLWIGAETVKDTHAKHAYAWTAGIGYGDYDIAKQGTWDVKAQYFNFGSHMGAISSKWNIAYDSTQSDNTGHIEFHGYKGWLTTVNYALQDNLGLSAYAGFKGRNNPEQYARYRKLSNYYRVELNYQF